LGGGLADMVVLQNLAHRPKEQTEEALALISELMPPLTRGELCSLFFSSLPSALTDALFRPRVQTESSTRKLTPRKPSADSSEPRQRPVEPHLDNPPLPTLPFLPPKPPPNFPPTTSPPIPPHQLSHPTLKANPLTLLLRLRPLPTIRLRLLSRLAVRRLTSHFRRGSRCLRATRR
jgi:hypothetical protein